MTKVNVALFCALWLLSDLCVGGFEEGALGAQSYRAVQSQLDVKVTTSNFQNSNKRVLLLDYDGTLAKFHNVPEKAVPSTALSEVLQILNEDPRTLVAIISGRDQEFLQKHFAKYQNFLLSAEHGAFERPPRRNWQSVSKTQGLDNSWKGEVQETIKDVQSNYPHETAFTHIEVKETGVVFHYRKLAEAHPSKEHPIAQDVLREARKLNIPGVDLKVEHDACAIDVRPQQFSKGGIAVSAWKRLPDAKMVICVGDSQTDEAMFQSLHDLKAGYSHLFADVKLLTVHVRNGAQKATVADKTTADVQSVVDLLRAFYKLEPKDV